MGACETFLCYASLLTYVLWVSFDICVLGFICHVCSGSLLPYVSGCMLHLVASWHMRLSTSKPETSSTPNSFSRARYRLKRDLYLLKRALYSLQKALYFLKRALCSLQRDLNLLKRALCSLQKALYFLKRALCSLQRDLYLLKRAMCSLQKAMYLLSHGFTAKRPVCLKTKC